MTSVAVITMSTIEGVAEPSIRSATVGAVVSALRAPEPACNLASSR